MEQAGEARGCGGMLRRLDRKRRVAVGIAVGLALLAALGAACVVAYDALLLTRLREGRSYGGLYDFLFWFRLPGQGEPALVLILLVGALGRRRVAWRMLLAMLLVAIAVWALKPTVGRVRPNARDAYSFPSGDAATAAALVAPLGTVSPWLLGPAAGVAAGCAVLRVYDNAHYPSDALAGLAIGLLAGVLACFWNPFRWRWPRRIRSRHWGWAFLVCSAALLAPAVWRGRGTMIYVLQYYLPTASVALAASRSERISLGGACTRRSACAEGACRAWLTGWLIVALAGGALLSLVVWFLPLPEMRRALAGLGAGLLLAGGLGIAPLRVGHCEHLRRVTRVSLCTLMVVASISLTVSWRRYRDIVRAVEEGLMDPGLLALEWTGAEDEATGGDQG